MALPRLARDVFLDNEISAATVAAGLVDTEQRALKRGAAVAIGHPHTVTLTTLARWLRDWATPPRPTATARNIAAGA